MTQAFLSNMRHQMLLAMCQAFEGQARYSNHYPVKTVVGLGKTPSK